MENLINEVLNDSQTINILKRIDRQPQLLAGQFDSEEPACLEKVINKLFKNQVSGKYLTKIK